MLDDTAIERFARQIVVPGVGAEGQERICSARILITGEPTGVALAQAYARAAGFPVLAAAHDTPACVLVAGTHSLDAKSLDDLRAAGAPILWYRIDEETIVAGTAAAGEPLDDLRSSNKRSPGNEIRHALAAADLVAAAVGLVLGWTDVEPAFRLHLR